MSSWRRHSFRFRPQDSNPGLKAPKACVLPLHQGGPRALGQRSVILSQAAAHHRLPRARGMMVAMAATASKRTRMSASERREQLIDVARALFAEKGFEGTAIEEIASRAKVSKPVVYEHFGGKEGLYAVIVDRK